MTKPLPPMPDGLTAEWLTDLFHASGTLPNHISITEVSQSTVGEGTGMMSELCRLHLTPSSQVSDLPATLIAKYPSRNPTNREVAMSFNLYEREVRYFAELDAQTTACAPPTHIATLDGDNFVIIMQDMQDYAVGDQTAGADLHQSELAIDELARLHSAFYGQVDHLDWIPGIADSYHADNMYNFCGGAWDVMVDAFADSVPPPITALKTPFLAKLPALQQRMNASPRTLVHGDFRMENILYGTQPEHHKAVIIDWQGPLLGQGLVDVCLMLGQSTRTSIRRAHERALLDRYVAGLRAEGCEYPGADVWLDYRLSHLYNWVYVAVVSGTLDSSNATAHGWMSKMIERQVHTTLDLDLIPLLDTL